MLVQRPDPETPDEGIVGPSASRVGVQHEGMRRERRSARLREQETYEIEPLKRDQHQRARPPDPLLLPEPDRVRVRMPDLSKGLSEERLHRRQVHRLRILDSHDPQPRFTHAAPSDP